jgi:N-acetylated-alpha-linked acidic dipeptidase
MTRTSVTIAAGLLAAAASALPAQEPLTGFAPRAAVAQAAAEREAIGLPDPARARAHARALTLEPHVAGTDAQARTRDYVMQQMSGWGISTVAKQYDVWMPHATGVHVWRVSPDPRELDLVEPPIAGDSGSMQPAYLPVNGYSGQGDVTGEVVYVNYGLVEDYAQLDSVGVSVKGRVVVARYGRSFRGIKAREAEKRGAAALLMYSDPIDDGYVRGDVYPEGPMRPPQGVQRGSIYNGSGDPSTPGWASVNGARRLAESEMTVARIPVAALSYAAAQELLRDLRGAAIPQAWQGGLPFRYHVGPGPVAARVQVRDDRATRPYKPIWNTLGTIRGSEFPDEIIVIGAHRDSWNAGAVDNVSGTVSVLEAARAIAEQVRAGRRPKRTIVFATWDAEEWGLVGSTEYVEEDAARLTKGGVAYLNQDVAASGSIFGAGGSPSLRSALRSVVRQVESPAGGGSVYDQWRRTSRAPDGAEPAMGDPGGGSDFAGFYNHLGIPHADWGFGGPGGVYHSHYDTFEWMTTFGDTNFANHAAAARIAAAMALRLANADVLPYDYVEFARTMRRHLAALHEQLTTVKGIRADTAALGAAVSRMETAATRFATARDRALRSELPRAKRERVNTALRQVERALTRPEGLQTRPWYRTLVYAADENNGYGNVVFPSVVEAARRDDATLTAAELADLVTRFGDATRAIDAATAALR